jgi:membrane-associated protease RseP (regulator of RpoE activity)
VDGSPAASLPSVEARGSGPPPPRRRRPLPPAVNLACFLLTVYSTLVAGTLWTLDDLTWPTLRDVMLTPSLWPLGASYSLCLILILGAHEMGHYVACRLYRIDASLPFFLPAPNLFGTFGAVIRIRGAISHRRALFDIGVAGPIAGFVVAVPVLLYGLSLSTVTHAPPKPGDVVLPSCLLLDWLYPRFFPAAEASIQLHPAFGAAWLGLFATSLNLIPIGQLDGGHMLYALSRRAHAVVSRLGIPLLIVLGIVFKGWHLVTFGLIFALIGPGHPPLLDEADGLGPGRLAVGLLGLLIFIGCFILRFPAVL